MNTYRFSVLDICNLDYIYIDFRAATLEQAIAHWQQQVGYPYESVQLIQPAVA